MKNDIKKPNYDESILSLSISLLNHYGISSHHSSLPELDAVLSSKPFKNIIFMVLDGLGSYVLDTHLSKNAFLQKNKIKDISSVFPPTTTAATTTMRSGLTPKEHGWIAWSCYFKETNECIELFTGKNFHTQKSTSLPTPVSKILSYETILDKIKNTGVETTEIYPAFMPNGAKNMDEFCAQINTICAKPNKQFAYAYWDQPDHDMHEKGVLGVTDITNIIANINEKLENCINQHPDTLFVITADHGHLDVKESLLLNDAPEIMECFDSHPTMEPRVISFKIKDDMKTEFKSRFNTRYGSDFMLIEKQQYIDDFLGAGKSHCRIDDFVGDFVAISITDKALYYNHPENEEPFAPLKGLHAGITSKEMLVPLIVATKSIDHS